MALTACQMPLGQVLEPLHPEEAPAPRAPSVAISELMYHPVLENAAQERHEYIELANPGVLPRSLAGWQLRIDGKTALVLPPEASIAAGGFLVLAKDRQALLAEHEVGDAPVIGDYAGELDNGGDSVALLDADGGLVDVVRYDDQMPWPVGADALGASRAWFPAGEYDSHRHRGRSLERWSFTAPGSDPANWQASPAGGGSPGQPNSVAGDPPATALLVSPRGAAVSAGAPVPILVRLSPGAVTSLSVEWFIDDLTRDGEPPQRAELAPGDPGQVEQAGAFRAELPAVPEGSLVRYRILGRRSGDAEAVIAPRPGDPQSHYLLYVNPAVPPPADAYQVFVAPARWTEMWTNLGSGPNSGCELNPRWDARVPAVMVRSGRVHDVQVRYQGSRYQRWNGFKLPPWPAGSGPSAPADFKALSWRLSFPAHDRLDHPDGGRRQTVTLNKQNQSCPGVVNHVVSKMFWAASVRTTRFRFTRLYLNGRYYHYMMEVEDIDEDLLGKTDPAGQPLGDLFKSDGAIDDQGPWGRGNFGPLGPNASCPTRFSTLDRYRTTYERQTHEWKNEAGGHDELIAMIEGLRPLYEAAKQGATGGAADPWAPVRAHLERHFDVPQVLTSLAVRNFTGVWDDGVHNFYLYRRAADGKHELLPQDFDLELGGNGRPSTASIFSGEEGVGLDPVGGVNWLKSAFLKAYREPYRARFMELLGTTLSPDNVSRLFDQALADWDPQSWTQSPALAKCDGNARIAAARTWLTARYAALSQQGLR